MKKRSNDILSFLHGSKNDMLNFLEELVLIETPSRNPSSQSDGLDLIQRSLLDISYNSVIYPGKKSGGVLLSKPDDRAKRKPLQLVLGHLDTVWPKGTLKTMSLRVDDLRMTGPGIYDMKAGLVQMIYALKTIRKLGLPTKLDPIILINTDEEIGSHDSTPLIRRLAKITKRALIVEPPLGLKGKLKTSRKGLARFTMNITGQAAHAGLDPDKGVSAIVELSFQIQRLFDMNDAEKGISVNVGMIDGGISPNVIAPHSSAIIDVRAKHKRDAEEISKRILALKPNQQGIHLKISGGFGRPPMEENLANIHLWSMAKDLGHEIGLSLDHAMAGGGSDGNTTSQYTATLDGLGTPGDGAHAPHEFIFQNQIVQRTALLTLLLLAPEE